MSHKLRDVAARYGKSTDRPHDALADAQLTAAVLPNLLAAHNITTLYDEAHHSRLCAEKFMMDGRHSGTGGGNHMILGGSTPSDSPILRRPDLLRSLIAYWH
ncbi:MAG: hypothetical protein EBZ46_03870, partial [Actinobacteria bacterium]|nr:hypothetical protein [Actinomycetota bacterium]